MLGVLANCLRAFSDERSLRSRVLPAAFGEGEAPPIVRILAKSRLQLLPRTPKSRGVTKKNVDLDVDFGLLATRYRAVQHVKHRREINQVGSHRRVASKWGTVLLQRNAEFADFVGRMLDNPQVGAAARRGPNELCAITSSHVRHLLELI